MTITPLNKYNKYGTWFVEAEAMMGLTNDDEAYSQMIIADMDSLKRRQFRRQVLHLYWLVGHEVEMDDVEEMLGELMRIANNTAPNFAA